MFKNIVFVGGIHGVGKSHFCKEIAPLVDLEYLSASDMINWSKIKDNPQDKRVENIGYTQDLLITGLAKKIKAENQYLLDGHFCLFDALGGIKRVPIQTFTRMEPILLITVTKEPSIIIDQLRMRGGKIYDIEILERMQHEEVLYSHELAETLNVPILIYKDQHPSEVIDLIKRQLT